MTEPTWAELAYQAVLDVAKCKQSFTTDDVMESMGDVPCDVDKHVMGSVMTRAATAGAIRKTDSFIPCKRKNQHGSPRRVWISLEIDFDANS